MNEVFENNLGDIANFSDNGITLEYTIQEKKTKQYYPYGSIMSIKVSGLIGIALEIIGKDIAANGKNYLTAIPFNKVDKTRMKSAVAFAESKMRTAPREKVVVTDCTSAPVEHHMRCNICGHIFCYTDADVKRNLQLQQDAKRARNMAVSEALGGTRLASNQQTAAADKYESMIVDYSKCPHCNSRNLTEINEDDAKSVTNSQTDNETVASAADELKKFKELLDMGIITQEEFDAKKKQLLGL